MYYIFRTLVSILLLSASVAYGKENNIIVNGGFESGGNADVSSNWKDNSSWADVNVNYERVFIKERNGIVQKIICNRFKHGAVQFVQSGMPIQNGDIYRVSFWAKGNIDVPLEVLLRKQGKPYTAYHSRAFKITNEWKKYSYIAPVNVSDSSVFFMFKFTSKGEVFLDDVTVSATDNIDNLEERRDGNLLDNGSFEIGTDRWGVQYRGLENDNEMPVRAMELKAYIDPSRSKYGNFSLKIPSVDISRFILNSENVVLTPNKNHSLSFWAYSETERAIQYGIVSGYFGKNRKQLKTTKVGSKWKKYTISTITELSEDNAYFVSIEGRGPGSIWIDGVQLVEGQDETFENRSLLEIGFTKQLAHPIYSLNENISLPVRIVAHNAINDCKVKVNTIDYYGEKKTIYFGDCNLETDLNRVIILTHSSNKPGYFRLIAEVVHKGKVIDSSEYAIGVIPKIPDTTVAETRMSPFGGHGRFAASELETLSRLGVKWLRMHPPLGTKWSHVEKEKGHYRYYDKEILLAKNAGFQILGSLDETPRWASTAPENENQFWSYSPQNYDAWENYVYNIVSHFKGIIDYWEVGNEPDSGGFLKVTGALGVEKKPGIYVELLKRAYRAAKKANPNAVIIGGCPTGKPPSRWLKSIIELGALDYMDVVSFHYYTDSRPGDVLDSPTSVDIQEIRSLMQLKLGRIIPIWETESGIMYPKTEYHNLKEISPFYAVPGEEAVAYLIRNYIHLIASGVEKWFYYGMFTSQRVDRREATGFFEWDGAPRPMSVAFAVLSYNLSGLEYSDTYNIDNAVKATKFTGKNRDLLVVSAKLWKDNISHRVTMSSSDSYTKLQVYNAMGNEIDFTIDGNTLEFDVGREPVYVVTYRD